MVSGAFMIGLVAVMVGGGLAVMGVTLALDAGSFASGEEHRDRGFLGLGGSEGRSASVPTAPWVGLLLTLSGLGILGLGLKGMMREA